MPALADRCRDTTTTTGTGTITVTGSAPTGFVTIASCYAVGDCFPYAIIGSSEWEVGLGTILTSTTFSRDQVFSSSNSNNVVTFSAGTKEVFADLPASLVNDFYGTAIAMQLNWALP